MSTNPLFSAVYQQVHAAGTRYALPEPWNRLPTDGAAFCCPADSETLQEGLQREFPLEVLQRSGVLPGRDVLVLNARTADERVLTEAEMELLRKGA